MKCKTSWIYAQAVAIAGRPSGKPALAGTTHTGQGAVELRSRRVSGTAVVAAAALAIVLIGSLVVFSARAVRPWRRRRPLTWASTKRDHPLPYQPVTTFAERIAKQPNLVGYYSGWGEPFKTSFAETVHQHGAITILQMDPSWASSRRSPRESTTPICARSPAACARSASPWSSASATR